MINKATIKGVEHDINDARLPSTLGTAGQTLVMNSAATGIEWGSAGGGSEKMYRHNVMFKVRLSIGIYIPKWTVETNFATPFTSSTFSTWLAANKPDEQIKVAASYPSYGYPMLIGFFYLEDATNRYAALFTKGYSDLEYLTKVAWAYNGIPDEFSDTVTEL